ncbi:hypothetical protein ACL1HS_04055 [Corynebacterium striatum]|uniref:hypothetical protein n=1 Tax=Corynebacterium striatum TaxID=43770 RepID=UPI0006279D3F|nr:hypothetical protein [Corynebacterium striatum]KKO78220.1 hypothetical protein WU85_08050 [Corynebacterium striatum]MBD0853291.1 hypothetical protein [Corynebacterium striatum]MDK8844401.1 hypothetical protein [Corynebacterium striatum]NHY10187.1 hypothetical protein [Corynebacterium striatum]NHY34607.1 hypothetical protein [Corynebacterium striatum]
MHTIEAEDLHAKGFLHAHSLRLNPGIDGIISSDGADSTSPIRTIAAARGILLVYFLAIATNRAAYTSSIPIEAPYPGLFIFSGIAIISSVVLMWRLPRHIHP